MVESLTVTDSVEKSAEKRMPINGVRMSATSEFTMAVKAAPITIPTARSITLPRRTKSRNSRIMALLSLGECAPMVRPIDSDAMRLATWNVNSLKARLERVLAWTERHQPDILCMQETKLSDTQAPLMDFSALGYELLHHGPGRWNGVAIASRSGFEDIVTGIPTADGWTDDGGRFLAAGCGGGGG